MALNKSIVFLSLLITVFIFVSLLLLGSYMDLKREEVLNSEFDRMLHDLNEMQSLLLMPDEFTSNVTCIAFREQLNELDSYVWKLGENIDKYRIASEEFYEDEYYFNQKKVFNEYEVQYFLITKRMIEKCDLSKKNILFFYKDSKECGKCDDQSFVLRDINYMNRNNDAEINEVGVFSFDMDLN
ncbi:hypothetical protein KY321_03805, partial [Candidatus Woesearchaeota archaeon]|nr:hypothetical protein [Candidatus Woesearchaeota archaeon]